MKQILPRIELLAPVINVFSSCFTKPQFIHFSQYLSGLITLQNKTVDGITSASITSSHQSSLNRFLTASPWSEEDVEQKYYSLLRYTIGSKVTSLIIDDSIAEKTGKHIQEAQYHWSHTGTGFVFGHQCVTAALTTSDKLFPLFPRLYSKHTSSKIEIAKQLIQETSQRVQLSRILLDSWYMAADILKCARKHKVEVIGCLKSNRMVSPSTGVWKRLNTWRKSLRAQQFTTLRQDDEIYRYYEHIVRIKHVGMVKILFTQQWDEECKKWSKTFYLMATDTQRTASEILTLYLQRWAIETIHRDVKQNLGFSACQIRTRKGIIRHLILCVLAYAVLKFWIHRKGVVWTIAQTIREIQRHLFDTFVSAIVEEKDVLLRRQMAEPFIRESAKA